MERQVHRLRKLEHHRGKRSRAPLIGGKSAAPVGELKFSPIDGISYEDETRYDTGISELDRVLGGGLVKGSLVLIGGDPGIGKSTLLLQICGFMSSQHTILYVSGEESERQISSAPTAWAYPAATISCSPPGIIARALYRQ